MPIALTNCLCEILERMINNRLLYVLEKEKLLCPFQSGFRRKRCTNDNLTRLEHDIKDAFSKSSSVLALFLDVQKAYDMTWRRGILQKLYDMGFRGNLPIFIANMLEDRRFKVRIGAEYSDTFIQENGVPQGSVISPTLFMILINDLLSNFSPHIKYALYADDIVIWCDLENSTEVQALLQGVLDKIGEWQDLWGTRFSPNKSNYVIFSRKHNLPIINLNIKGVNVPSAESVFFLGLKFDRKLRWHEHVKYLYDACHKRLNLLRSLQNQAWGADRYSLILIYKSYIRAKFDYGCHLYDAAATSIKKKLNTIQNAALKLAVGALGNTNTKKLEVEAHVPSLQKNREYMSMNYGLKIIADIQHPTRPCLMDHHLHEFTNSKPFSRRLYEMGMKVNLNIYDVDNSGNFSIPPWICPRFELDFSIHNGTKAQTPIEILYNRSLEVIASYGDSEHYYTDGSVSGEKTGIGIFHKNYNECVRLPEGISIFTAETYAIFLALKQGLSTNRDFTIFTDSYSCLSAIHSFSDHPLITRILNILYHSSLTITLCWIPSHCGVFGNEQADRIAKRALDLCITVIKIPKTDLLRIFKNRIYQNWQIEFNQLDTYKIKTKISQWDTSFNNRKV